MRILLTLSIFLILNIGTAYTQDCEGSDCLWPGDANRNGVCNNMDLLWIGLANQSNIGGDVRPSATSTWTPQNPPNDWLEQHPVSNINYKYADTNGDGWIDGVDYEIFPNLYNQSNDQFTGFMGHEILGPDLHLEVSDLTPAPGQTVSVSIQLGSAAMPINDIYGIAFSIEFDTAIVAEQLTTFSNEGGWMNSPDANLYTSSKIDALVDIHTPQFAYVSQGGEAQSGFGEICKMDIVIEDVIIGIDGEPMDSVELALNFKRVLGLNAFEEDMMITVNNTPILVNNTHIKPIDLPDFKVSVQTDHILIAPHSELDRVRLLDYYGRLLAIQTTDGQASQINTSHLTSGIYLLSLETKKGKVVKKIPVFR